MIKNVVFDFGKVMVHFEPSYMVGKYVSDPSDAKLLEEVLFDRLYWDRADAGTITDEEVVAACKARLPARLHEVSERIYWNWIYNLPEIDGMRELVQSIKSKYGVRVFLLSNISMYFAEHAHEIPCLAEFETCIFSAVCGYVKPSKEIFEYLCKTCEIEPHQTLFVDDSEKNIRGSEAYGIQGYLFDGDAKRLSTYLDTLLE